MIRDYYNTNGESGAALRASEEHNRNQDAAVLAHFQAYPRRFFAPHQIPMPEGTPLTSVRRSITNLTKAGILVKTKTKVPGTMGRGVGTWRLATKEEKQEQSADFQRVSDFLAGFRKNGR